MTRRSEQLQQECGGCYGGSDMTRLRYYNNGGLSKWSEAGYALSTELPQERAQKGRFFNRALRGDDLWVSTTEVEQIRADEKTVLIDARSKARFCGEEEQVDPVGGHIPGAVSRPFDG